MAEHPSYETASIPEMLGFSPIPFDRERPYSEASYRAQYLLTEEEAREVRARHSSHRAIDRELGLRFVSDAAYRRRVTDFMRDISQTEPTEEVRRLMDRSEARIGTRP